MALQQYQDWHAEQMTRLGIPLEVAQSITALANDLRNLSNQQATQNAIGLVKQMALAGPVTGADMTAAPVAYDQSYTQDMADLVNETKDVLNQLIINSQAAGQMGLV